MEVLCCLKVFFLEFFPSMCDFTCDIFVYLKFPILSLLWRNVPYLSRLCSNATRSLKIFLLSFPSGIKSPIFSAPQNFTPIFLPHRLCLPGISPSAFSAQAQPPWEDGLYLTHFRSSLADMASSQVTSWMGLNGWLPNWRFSQFVLWVGLACVVSSKDL